MSISTNLKIVIFFSFCDNLEYFGFFEIFLISAIAPLCYIFVVLVPGRSPENVRGDAETSTSVYIKWDKVASNFVHGVLLGYNLTVRKTKDWSLVYSSKISTNGLVNEEEIPVYLENLDKYTEYSIWVRAVNSKGHGKLNSPEGYRVRTKEDGRYMSSFD